MGFGLTELIIVLIIVVLLFGTKKLRNLGGDLGGALKNFRNAMGDVDEKIQVSPKNDSESITEATTVITENTEKEQTEDSKP